MVAIQQFVALLLALAEKKAVASSCVKTLLHMVYKRHSTDQVCQIAILAPYTI